LSSNNLFFKKRVKVILAKSTTALTCLLGLLIISRASAQSTTVTGSMAASQTGKTAGSYTKTMTLNIVY
jgi:hypothetical protein